MVIIVFIMYFLFFEIHEIIITNKQLSLSYVKDNFIGVVDTNRYNRDYFLNEK